MKGTCFKLLELLYPKIAVIMELDDILFQNHTDKSGDRGCK